MRALCFLLTQLNKKGGFFLVAVFGFGFLEFHLYVTKSDGHKEEL